MPYIFRVGTEQVIMCIVTSTPCYFVNRRSWQIFQQTCMNVFMQVIRGLDEGILSMKAGGKRRLYIPGEVIPSRDALISLGLIFRQSQIAKHIPPLRLNVSKLEVPLCSVF